MTHLNQMELQNLRHLIGDEQRCASKCQAYAQITQDQQLQQFLQREAQMAQSNAQKLIQFLQ